MNILFEVLVKQLNNNFLLTSSEENIIKSVISDAADKTKTSLSAFNNKYYTGDINPYNSVMYCIFLYWLSKTCKNFDPAAVLSDKIYYLNKMMNAVDLFYEINLPEHWSCEHPVGSVMGRAEYGDYFFFTQGCTVGGNWNNGELKYPVIGNNVRMLSNSKIVGDSHIGNHVIMSANSYVINRTIPDNSIVFGQGNNIIIKENKNI